MNDTDERTLFRVVRVDDEGVWASGPDEGVYDVLFDGRRIWSFWFLRDSKPTDDPDSDRLARWPRTLLPYLNGHARITVREHVGEVVVFDEQVRFGDGDAAISITDADGRPLATDKTGQLERVFDGGDPREREALLDTIEHVLESLREIGIQAFPAYGTLLGAVRNGALIGHDSDADLAYVSDLTSPVDLIRESYRIDRHLRERGYSVQRHSGFAMKIYVVEDDGTERGLDVFGGAYINGKLFVMGEIGAEFDRDRVYPLGTCTLEGRTLPAPADAEGWLAITYGPNWRVPDPAFHFGTPNSTRKRFDGWFRGTRRFRDEWDGYWKSNHDEPSDGPSRFCEWVAGREPDSEVVVDIGSGLGADAVWYASTGRRSIGLDYSHQAHAWATHWAEQKGSSAEFATLNLCDMRSVLASGAWIARLPGKRVVTARRLTCSLDHRVRQNFWRMCSMISRDGTPVYLEIGDPEQRKVHADPTRRLRAPITIDQLAEEIAAAGGRIRERHSVESESPQPDTGERLRFTRMVVTWQKDQRASAA